MTHSRRLILTLSLLLAAPTLVTRASDKPLLIELELRDNALPAAVNTTGTTVVGGFANGGGFYWMPTTGVIAIAGAFASDVSSDGRIIVGQALDSNRILQAAIWVRAAEWRLLGSVAASAAPCDAFLSSALGTNADGRVVVGYARNGCTFSHAFRWEESTGMVDLGSSVAGKNSLAQGVSADGKVVVGYQEATDGYLRGVRWVDGRQESIPGRIGYVGTAYGANADGSIVVGRICDPEAFRPTDANVQSAWVWTARDGTQCLQAPAFRPSPGPPVNTVAHATSNDGRVIGGEQGIGTADTNAILWIDRTPHYLKDYLRANGVPDAFERWVNTGSITDVSPDGRILVGNGAALGGFRGYIVILGEKP